MRRLLALAVMIPSVALAFGADELLLLSPPTSPVLARYALTSHGAADSLLPQTSDSTAHVVFRSGALLDLKGNVWTMNGSVPVTGSGPFTPDRQGAGPFSDSSYYSLGTGSDALDFDGDFTCTYVFNANAITANSQYLSRNGGSSAGWHVSLRPTTGEARFWLWDGVSMKDRFTANGVTVGGPNVVSVGRAGAAIYVKLNLGTTGSTALAAASNPSATASVLELGRYNAASTYLNGSIYEMRCEPVTWSEAAVERTQRAAFGVLGTKGEVAGVTRATTATYAANGGAWAVPPDIMRVTPTGALIEGSGTNYALQSGTLSTGAAMTAPWSSINTTVSTATSGGRQWLVAAASATGSRFWYFPTTPSATTFVASVRAKAASGTNEVQVTARCPAGVTPTCACAREDGGACSTVTYPAGVDDPKDCTATATVDTVGTRLSAITTCTAEGTTPGLIAGPGLVSAGTAHFTEAQIEIGTAPSSYIPTTTVAATRNADAPATTLTMPRLDKWCVRGTFTNNKWNASGVFGLVAGGSPDAANSFDLVVVNQSLFWQIFDASGNLKRMTYDASAWTGAQTLVACVDAGTLSLTRNGAPASGVSSGVGTGILGAWPSPIRLGARDPGQESNGTVRDVAFCKTYNASRCR